MGENELESGMNLATAERKSWREHVITRSYNAPARASP